MNVNIIVNFDVQVGAGSDTFKKPFLRKKKREQEMKERKQESERDKARK